MSDTSELATPTSECPRSADMDTARLLSVLQVGILRRGAGTPNDPVRVITQYFSTNGTLLAEYDPCGLERAASAAAVASRISAEVQVILRRAIAAPATRDSSDVVVRLDTSHYEAWSKGRMEALRLLEDELLCWREAHP